MIIYDAKANSAEEAYIIKENNELYTKYYHIQFK